MDDDVIQYINLHFDNQDNTSYGRLVAMFTKSTGIEVPVDSRAWPLTSVLKWNEWREWMDQRARAWIKEAGTPQARPHVSENRDSVAWSRAELVEQRNAAIKEVEQLRRDFDRLRSDKELKE